MKATRSHAAEALRKFGHLRRPPIAHPVGAKRPIVHICLDGRGNVIWSR